MIVVCIFIERFDRGLVEISGSAINFFIYVSVSHAHLSSLFPINFFFYLYDFFKYSSKYFYRGFVDGLVVKLLFFLCFYSQSHTHICVYRYISFLLVLLLWMNICSTLIKRLGLVFPS